MLPDLDALTAPSDADRCEHILNRTRCIRRPHADRGHVHVAQEFGPNGGDPEWEH